MFRFLFLLLLFILFSLFVVFSSLFSDYLRFSFFVREMARNESIGYCERFRADELVYHSSEQYLIMCLKLCSLILANGCSVRDLIADLNENNLNASAAAAADQDLKRLKKFQAFDDDLDLLRHLELQQQQQSFHI